MTKCFLEVRILIVHKYSQPLLNTLFKQFWQQLQPQVLKLGTPVFGNSQAPSVLRYFLISPELFSLVSGWATQEHSQTGPKVTPLLSWLCARDVCTLLYSSFPRKKNKNKTSPQLDGATTMFSVGIVLARWWMVPGFLQIWRFVFSPKSSVFVS